MSTTETVNTSCLSWLDQLHLALHKTQCRLHGKRTSLEAGLQRLQHEFRESKARDTSVIWIGNGGSAAIGSHLSQDLLNKWSVRSLLLSDPALVLCLANDFGVENVFSHSLERVGRAGDLLVAISSSGRSKNILNAVAVAKAKKMRVVSLSAFDSDNPLWNEDADLAFHLPSHSYGIAEVGHEALIHAALETGL